MNEIIEGCIFFFKGLDFNLLIRGCLRKLIVFFDLSLKVLVEFIDEFFESGGFILKILYSDLLVGSCLRKLMVFYDLSLEFLFEIVD